MKNNTNNIELDKIKKTCAEIISKRENILEERSFLWVIRLLYQNCKTHIFLSLTSLLLLFWFLKNQSMNNSYIFVYLYMGVLGISATVEICKEFRYQIGELCMPTRIGGAKLMSYTLIALSFLQIICFIIIIFCGSYYYALDFYKILWLTIIPCFVVNGITLQVATYFTSINSSIASYFIFHAMYYVVYHFLFQEVNIEQISVLMLIIVFGYYTKCCYSFQYKMNKNGGYLLWN